MNIPYLPHTPEDVKEMLEKIGAGSIEDLFNSIPQDIQIKNLKIPSALSEPELIGHVKKKTSKNQILCSFIGGGSYDHFIPSAIDTICSRSEFYTAYTPYQAEVSQGTLQMIYEFQSMICALTGLDVANASLYDGASAVAEAAMVAGRQTRKKKIIVPKFLHPNYRKVLDTYLAGTDLTIEEIPSLDGLCDIEGLQKLANSETAAVMVQQPNFLGFLEPVHEISAIAKEAGALVISVFNPLSLGVLISPAEYDADIAVGEGQCLGVPQWYGGPGLGLIAAKDSLKRSLPGRIVGQTVDKNEKRGYVLTLQAREQHIRREKATSNICSNQGLCALAASVYMALMGPEGFKTVGRINLEKSHEVFEKLIEISGIEPAFEGAFFNEFTVKIDKDVPSLILKAAKEGLGIGIHTEHYFPELKNCLTLCVTENRTEEEIEKLINFFKTNLGN